MSQKDISFNWKIFSVTGRNFLSKEVISYHHSLYLMQFRPVQVFISPHFFELYNLLIEPRFIDIWNKCSKTRLLPKLELTSVSHIPSFQYLISVNLLRSAQSTILHSFFSGNGSLLSPFLLLDPATISWKVQFHHHPPPLRIHVPSHLSRDDRN